MSESEFTQETFQSEQDNSTPVLEVSGLTKRFPGVTALDNVDLTVYPGEVHAIVGENGAGKSTFCNIVTGIMTPDEGEIHISGKLQQFTHPAQALQAGIRMVYQERNLIHFLTGAQNICLGEEPVKWGGIVNEKILYRNAEKLRKRIGIDIPLEIRVSEMSAAQRQMIEILRALLYKPALLILDEPTSSLTESDVEILFKTLRQIKEEGISIIFISHKMEEVFSISDVISIFRNGKKIITKKNGEMDREECIRYMVNRNIESLFPDVHPSDTENVLELESISDGIFLHDINLSLRKGEVVGLYGLVGSGRTELAELLYGLRPIKEGKVYLNQEEIIPSTKKMLDKKVFLVPEDRREKGLFFNLNLRTNLTISFFDRLVSYLGIIKKKETIGLAKKIADSDQLKLKYSNINQNIDELSGGNKQKIVIGRWISHEEVNVLIMDEPTQGIDVGAKYEVYTIIRHHAEKRKAGVLFISSELPELIGVCDRIYVFKDGTVAGELSREEFDGEKILHFAL
ncbi:MAG: sugar ABC transporter ATP-binding protein [Spirochaetes bacterium]|nr:sugar ABC transporter ATP-binding protein [Spirochaetota bacterium]